MTRSFGFRGLVTMAAVAVGLSPIACHEPSPLRLSVQSPATSIDCARLADGVFVDAAFERVADISGPDLFYTPRVRVARPVTPTSHPALGWGIGVWVKPIQLAAEGKRCEFELESLQQGPMCGAQCVYVPQRGAEYDQALKDFAQRLSLAAR